MEITNAISERLKTLNNTKRSTVQTTSYTPKRRNGEVKADILNKLISAFNPTVNFFYLLDNAFIVLDNAFIVTIFEDIATELANLRAQNIIIENTLDNSLLIKSDLKDSRLYIELFFIDEEPRYDVVVNLYKNQNHVFGTAGLTGTVFTKFNQFLA